MAGHLAPFGDVFISKARAEISMKYLGAILLNLSSTANDGSPHTTQPVSVNRCDSSDAPKLANAPLNRLETKNRILWRLECIRQIATKYVLGRGLSGLVHKKPILSRLKLSPTPLKSTDRPTKVHPPFVDLIHYNVLPGYHPVSRCLRSMFYRLTHPTFPSFRPRGVIRSTSCLVLRWSFRGRRIEWR